MIIAPDQLSPRALQRIIEDFVTRDGTDSGYTRKSLEDDVRSVMDQIRRGDAVITYDPATRSVSIASRGSRRSAGSRVNLSDIG